MSEHAPYVDLASGALKERAFCDALAQEVRAAHAAGTPLCLLVLDLDDAVEQLDLHGAGAVDAALQVMAEVASESSEGRFLIGRTGDDELSLLVAGLSTRAATLLAERIRAEIEARGANGVRITVSLGVAALRPAELWGNLLDGAREACIHAKQAGRNTSAHR